MAEQKKCENCKFGRYDMESRTGSLAIGDNYDKTEQKHFTCTKHNESKLAQDFCNDWQSK